MLKSIRKTIIGMFVAIVFITGLAYTADNTDATEEMQVVGCPEYQYPKVYIPGKEKLHNGELRITILGSGNPWVTRYQAAGSILVEVGNSERDLLLFDIGSGSLSNFASLKLPVNKLNKVFLSHLHADHTSDLITLVGSYAKIGRSDGPVYLWGPSGTEPSLGTNYFADGIMRALEWDAVSSGGSINPESLKMETTEFDWRKTRVIYNQHNVKVTSFPVIHALSGSVGYRLDFAGLTFVFSGDARPSWPLVYASEPGDAVHLLIHECFPPAEQLAEAANIPIEQAEIALESAHTSPTAAGTVFNLVKPRLAGLWHTILNPEVVASVAAELEKVYKGPYYQTRDLTVFNITKKAVVARQAKVNNQLPPTPGEPAYIYVPIPVPPPPWWEKAAIPVPGE